MPDYGGEFPLAQGEAKLGLNLGTVRPKSKITLEYDVVADAAVESVPALWVRARASPAVRSAIRSRPTPPTR